MKKPFFCIYSLFAIVLLINGCCTDVPLSFTKKISDTRLIGGYWVKDKTEAYKIEKLSDNSAILYKYKWDDQTKEYSLTEAPSPLYFTSITDNEGTETFLSFGDNSNHYCSVKYKFNTIGQLVVIPFNDLYLEKYFPKKKDDLGGVVTFGTTEKFRNFIKTKMRYADLYENSGTFDKASSL